MKDKFIPLNLNINIKVNGYIKIYIYNNITYINIH